jgi:CDP-glucose 4,6-dehydratase
MWLSRILHLLGAQVTGFALAPEGGASASASSTASTMGISKSVSGGVGTGLAQPHGSGDMTAWCPGAGANLYDILDGADFVDSHIGDIRDFGALAAAFDAARPEIVFHLAAQPLVRESYEQPVMTYETNVMGTVHILECVRTRGYVRSFLNVTTDKVYENKEWVWGYRESDPLDGYDPYSNSKSCSELVTHAYRKSFFGGGAGVGTGFATAISTARAGNVIGGGDFAKDRIIPDCVRAGLAGAPVVVRNPGSVRPYQHVLEPLHAYLLIAKAQWENPAFADSYNVGPGDGDAMTTGDMADAFCARWGGGMRWVTGSGASEGQSQKRAAQLSEAVEAAAVAGGYGALPDTVHGGGNRTGHGELPGTGYVGDNRTGQGDATVKHEANLLRLDCSKIRQALGWRGRYTIRRAVDTTVDWYRAYARGDDMRAVTDRQIREYVAACSVTGR